MSQDHRKAKIRWQSRRGMLELDVLIGRYLQKELATMAETDLDVLERFLAHPDPDLYAWLMGYESPNTQELADLVLRIRA